MTQPTPSPTAGHGALPRRHAVITPAVRQRRTSPTGISGSAVSDLTSNPNYPASPSGSETLTSLEAPSGWGNDFGDRVRGYLYPPASGAYTFWIASDETSELWLSTGADPANAVKIAWVPSKTSAHDWTANPEQQSAAITLAAGQRYYIEAIRKEAKGGDHLAVAWQGPTLSQQVIGGQYLSPWDGGSAQLIGPLRQVLLANLRTLHLASDVEFPTLISILSRRFPTWTSISGGRSEIRRSFPSSSGIEIPEYSRTGVMNLHLQ